jgi:hypothetical protein
MSKTQNDLIEIPLDVAILTMGTDELRQILTSNDYIFHFMKLRNFHKTRNVEKLNELIRKEGVLFIEPDEQEESDILDRIYMNEDKEEDLTYELEFARKRKVKFSSPILLAAAYRVVKEYPELIPQIENAVFVQRAINYMEGSYIDQLGRAFTKIFCKRDIYNSRKEIYRKARILLRNVLLTAKIMIVQYEITGKREYLEFLETIPLFQVIPLHKLIMELRPQGGLKHVIKEYDKYLEKLHSAHGEKYTAIGGNNIINRLLCDPQLADD